MGLTEGAKAFLAATSSQQGESWEASDLASIRALSEAREAEYDIAAPSMAREFSETMTARDGCPVPLDIYVPEGVNSPAGVLLFFHGGGWVLCSPRTHANLCRYLCAKSGFVGVNVGYRLAPEHKFPRAVEDAEDALTWTASNIGRFGGDPSRIVVAGDSAGGNLAAVVAQQAAREASVRVAGQLLIYPSLAMGVRDQFPSWQRLGTGEYGISSEGCDWVMDLYLNDESERRDTRFSPILAEDLSGLSPAMIITAQYDPLVDEGEAYTRRLRAAGGRADYLCVEGAIHSFASMAGAMPEGYPALDRAADFLRGVAVDA